MGLPNLFLTGTMSVNKACFVMSPMVLRVIDCAPPLESHGVLWAAEQASLPWRIRLPAIWNKFGIGTTHIFHILQDQAPSGPIQSQGLREVLSCRYKGLFDNGGGGWGGGRQVFGLEYVSRVCFGGMFRERFRACFAAS